MKKHYIKDIELLQFLFRALANEKLDKIKNHLDQCKECNKKYEYYINLIKPIPQPEEAPISTKKINSFYKSFIKKKLKPYKYSIIKSKWYIKFSSFLNPGSILILLGTGLFFLFSPSDKPGKMKKYCNNPSKTNTNIETNEMNNIEKKSNFW